MAEQSVGFADEKKLYSLKDFCKQLSISTATGKNWLKLNKITPTAIIEKTPYFSIDYINILKGEILSGSSKTLKSRRNKKYVCGNGIYKSYISPSSKNNGFVQQLVSAAASENLTDETISYILAEAGIRLLCQSKLSYPASAMASYLLEYLNKNFDLGIYKPLIDDFIFSSDNAKKLICRAPFLFDISWIYEPNEDILGLIYLSIKNIGDRKATGSYYTPTQIVKKLINNLHPAIHACHNHTIFDPCCGTGNFLLQLPDSVDIKQIYGNDIDLTSAKITRLNLAMKHKIDAPNILYEQITSSDFLTSKDTAAYDFIIGNPPWGYDFSDEERTRLQTLYQCSPKKSIESYDLFIEQSLNHLSNDGFLSFVLPEAILNAKTHTQIRSYILNNANITTLEYLGNVFDQVHCPCIILEIQKHKGAKSTKGMKVLAPGRSFTIETERKLNAGCFHFHATDLEYSLINKLTNKTNKTFLFNHADFALGIVTGNNKKFISKTLTKDKEPILKGSDIFQYQIKTSNNYICFTPEKFQQTAPTAYYRAPEKLLYRFICNQLVFAYDNQKTLLLNSCNMVIPHIKNMHIKYILAVLNSTIAQFLFEKQFHSIKVLRFHIESMPLPIVSKDKEAAIVNLVEQIMVCKDAAAKTNLYNRIDCLIAQAFHLSQEEYHIILHALENKNPEKYLIFEGL